MKRVLLLIILLVLIAAGYFGWIFMKGQPAFAESEKYLYIYTDSASKANILHNLERDSVITNLKVFEMMANRLDYWRQVKPGRYRIEKGDRLLPILRRLKNGQQTPIHFTIVKLRTRNDLARLMGRRFEFDSAQAMQTLSNPAFLEQYALDSATLMTAVLPDTYDLFWNSTPVEVFDKLHAETEKFWNDERRQQASEHNLSPAAAYTLASIVEEETNARSDKPNIASVYLNRMRLGMPLQADPTIKFAMQNFGLKRIYHKYLDTESPYNTYRNKGLPPGPICTPSRETLEAVLNAPQTDYLYFVANKDFSNTHIFTSNYRDHMKYAREYQQALNRQDSIRKGLLKE